MNRAVLFLFVFVLTLASVSAYGELLYNDTDRGSLAGVGEQAARDGGSAAEFTPRVSTYEAYNISLRLETNSGNGANGENWTAEIWSSGGDSPSALLNMSEARSLTTTASWAWYNFTFNATVLSTGSEYFINLRRSDYSFDGANFVSYGLNSTAAAGVNYNLNFREKPGDGGAWTDVGSDYQPTMKIFNVTIATPAAANTTNVTFKATSDLILNALYNVSITNGTTSLFYSDQTGEFTTNILNNSTGTFSYRVNSTNHYYVTGSFLAAENSHNRTISATQSTIRAARETSTTQISVGNAWATISSTTVNNSYTTTAYAQAQVETNASGAGTSLCRILIDGADQGSTATRSLTAGTYGNFYLLTNDFNVTTGTITNATIECRKSGGANYNIDQSILTIQYLYDTNNAANITRKHANGSNIAVSTAWQRVFNWTVSTQSLNITDADNLGYTFNYRFTPTYGADANITVQLRVNNDTTSCQNITRYGASGSTGSAGGACAVMGLAQGSTHNISVYASSSNGAHTLDAGISHNWQIQSPIGGANQSIQTSVPFTTTNKSLANVTIKNLIGGAYEVYVAASINSYANDTADTARFWIGDGTTQTPITRRTVGVQQPGNVFIPALYNSSGTGATTYQVYGFCGTGNCTASSVQIVAYVVDQQNTSTQNFTVYAWDPYTGTHIDIFNVTVDEAIYSTTTGSLTVPIDDNPESVIVQAGFYLANTTSHDTSTALNATLYRWTAIYATGPLGAINNFSIVFNASTYTTTNGTAYIPLYNRTAEAQIVNASHLGTDYQSITKNLTAGPYLKNYTFSLYYSNSFLLEFRNESTNLPLVNYTVFVEVISNIQSANYTSNGTAYLNVTLLQPATYTIRYYIDADVPRDYYVYLSNQSVQNLTLYTIDESISSLYVATVKDDSENVCENQTVSLLRYYLDINGYRTVEMARTSTLGDAVLRVHPNIINYKLGFSGSCGTFVSEPAKLIDTTNTYVVTDAQSVLTSFDALPSISRSLTFNNNTNTYTFTWADTNNLVTQGCLTVGVRIAGVRTNAYNQCSSGASGSLIFTLNNTNRTEYSATGTLTTNTEFSTLFVGPLSRSFILDFQTWGVTGLFLTSILLIAVSLIAAQGAASVVIASVGTLAMAAYIGIIYNAWSAIVALIVLGVIIAYRSSR